MTEELETELLDKSIGTLHTGIDCIKEDVKKFQTSQDSLEKLVQEKYQTLHEDLENVTSEVKDVETKLSTVDDRLSAVDKSIGILHTGIDGVKEDVKKFQTSQDSLEKLVQENIPVLSGNIESITSKVKGIETKLSTVDDRLRLSTVDDRLSTVDKSIGILRTGIDYVKEDVKKFQVSQGSLEKLVKEKIPVLSGNIEIVTSEVKDVKAKLSAVDNRLSTVDDRLDTVDKSIGIFCTGIDCVIEDVKKFQTSQDSLEKLVQEKIPVLSGNIENVTSKVKDVETKLGIIDDKLDTIDKSIGVFCTGIDGVKEDVKKFQVSQDSLEKLVQEKYQTLYEDLEKSHDTLEKFVQERFKELGEKVQGLEHPTFICENCGEQVIAPLSSYCSNCGSQIESWSDENGQPAKGWIPYWKRRIP